MKSSYIRIISPFIVFLVFFIGCGKPKYRITYALEEAIDQSAHCVIGPVIDKLHNSMAESEKPTLENINKFKNSLIEEIEKRELLNVSFNAKNPKYEISALILSYRKGDGMMRFIMRNGSGFARVLTAIYLKEIETGNTVFSGNFSAEVSSGLESGDNVFSKAAQDFAKELEKQMEAIE